MKRLVLLSSLLTLVVACSTQYRTADPQLSSSQMMGFLSDAVSSLGATSVGSGTSVSALSSDPSTTIFYADAPSPMGPIASVFAISTLDFLGFNSGANYTSLTQVRVFFLDRPTNSGHDSALVIGEMSGSGTTFSYHGFSGSGQVSGGHYSATLAGGNGHSLLVTSDDVENDKLTAVIQLNVYSLDSGGNSTYIGKFSTLAGYQ